ncbi:MAG TPA: hypothetical protein VKG21_03060, partial [Casimicrobiaceae bacterium]|nr:hypothetical protein [Casimicrobiaceae bacterium]
CCRSSGWTIHAREFQPLLGNNQERFPIAINRSKRVLVVEDDDSTRVAATQIQAIPDLSPSHNRADD